MKYNNKKSLITKILLSFGIMATVIIAVVFISFINFKRLFDSIEYLSKPDQKEVVLNRMYKDVASSLRSIRLYALTGNRAHYDRYVEKTSDVRAQILVLNEKDHAHLYKEHIDSLEHLLNLKDRSAQHLSKLIAKRKSMYTSLDNIKLQSDTVYYPSMAVETTTVNYMKAVPVKQEQRKNPVKRKSFFRRLFSFKLKNQDVPKDEGKPKVKYVPQSYFRVDTSIRVKAVPYSNIKEVRKQLARWGWRNKQIDEIITKEEEDLLHANDSFSEIIQKIISELREKERKDQVSNIQQAHLVVRKSTFIVLLIGISGIAGCVLFLILIGKDIRLSNIYRSKLSQEKRKAIRTARMKEQFLSNMSHEIRTPLGAIVGFSEQLDKVTLNPDQKKFVSAIRNSSDHLLSLVNDILDLSKIEAGKMPVEKVTFRFNEVAGDVYQNLKIKSDEKQLDFSYYIDPALSGLMRGDSLRLKQILFNLVGNSIKFTSSGSVKFSFQKLNESSGTSIVQILVSDTGVGIPAHKHSNIFNEFEQSYESDSRNFGGTGLGLAICKKLVTNMGGSIFFESEVDEGTSFTVLLPFDDVEEGEDQELKRSTSSPVSLKGKLVLVVEDDPYITLLMKIIFVKHQILATFAEDGKEGVQKFREGKFDLVIADMQLPELSGIEMIRLIRNEKDVPAILCSANVLENKKYKDLYSIRFLVKPFKEQQLIDTIINALSAEEFTPAPVFHNAAPSKMTKSYSLSGLQEIIRNEQEMRQLLGKIVSNGRSSVTELHTAIEDLDEKKVRKIVHKLIPSFTQLQADALVKQLEKINRNEGDVLDNGENLIQLLSSVLDELENDLVQNRLFERRGSFVSASELN